MIEGRDQLHDAVTEAWRSVLRHGPDHQPDFILAGGSSMDLVDLQLRVFKLTGRRFDLDGLKEPITHDTIVDAVEAASVEVPGSEVTRTMDAPATIAQESQWIIEQSNPNSTAYVVPVLVRFNVPVTESRIATALARLVEAHPALRTSVRPPADGEEGFRQVVHPANPVFALESRSVSGFDDEQLKVVLASALKSPPSIVRPSPLRAIALRCDGRASGLLLLLQHAAVDEWSIRVLVEDLDLLLQGKPIESEGRTQAEIGKRIATHESSTWWRERLADLPTRLAWPAPDGSSGDQRPLTREIDAERMAAFDEFCLRIGVEPASALVHLAAETAGSIIDSPPSDIAVAVPMSLRDDPRLDRTVGMLLNTLPVPVRIDAVDRIESIRNTRRTMRDIRRHRTVPLEELVRTCAPPRADDRVPWLDLMVGVVDRPIPDGPTCSARVLCGGESPAPLMVLARRAADRSLVITIEHDDRHVDFATARGFADRLYQAIRRIEDRSSNAPGVSRSSSPARSEPTSLVRIAEQAMLRHPDHCAIEGTERSLSHAELERESRCLAESLVRGGLGVGDVVAVDTASDHRFPIAVLGVLRAGCVVMPLSSDLPARRRALLLELAGSPPVVDAGTVDTLDASPAGLELPEVTAGDGCYLLFTSGSTGEPKGVRMPHGPIANLVEHETRRGGWPARTAMQAPHGFDVVFQEIFTTWSMGGTLVPVPDKVRRDPEELVRCLQEQRISRLHCAPVVLQGIARAAGSSAVSLPELQEVISAGESLEVTPEIRSLARRSGGFNLVNQYGPTETHVVSGVDLGRDHDAWPDRPVIGEAIDGVILKLVDEAGTDVAIGFEGEIHAGGRAPATGYLGDDPEERFIEDAEGRWYRTGDRGRMQDDGRIVFIGRTDEQVKISGHRVELAEVEQAIKRLDGVSDAAVVTALRAGDATLHAVVVPAAGSIEPDAIRDELIALFPGYMVPRTIVLRDSIPLTVNGKIDRPRLKAEAEAAVPQEDADRCETELEGILSRLVGNREWSRSQTLAGIGVDSLGAIRLQAEIESAFDVRVPVTEILSSTTEALEGRIEIRPSMVGSRARSSRGRSSEAAASPARPLDALERDLLTEMAVASDGAFHLAWRIDFPMVIDRAVIHDAVFDLHERHETLRTIRSATNGARVLRMGADTDVRIEVLDAPPSREVRQSLLRHRLDVENGECTRVAIWQGVRGTSVLMIVNHIAVDGRAAELLIDELVHRILNVDPGRFSRNRSADADTGHLDELDEHIAWWVAGIQQVTEGRLPDIPRREGSSGETVCQGLEDSAHIIRASRAWSRARSYPPMASLLAGWAIMIGRMVDREQVLIGVPFALDESRNSSIQLGATMLPIPVDVGPDRRLADVLSDVGRMLGHGLDHRQAAFGSIVKALGSGTRFGRTPLDAVMTVDPGDRTVEGVNIRWESIGVSPFQAAMVIDGKSSESISLQIESGLLDGEAMSDFTERFGVVMNAVLDSDVGDRTVADVPRFSTRQLTELRAWEDGGQSASDDRGLAEVVSTISARDADAIAVIDSSTRLTFGDLDRWSRVLAEQLISAGVRAGDTVAIPGKRCAAAIVSMLAVARVGGVYVPIDPNAPVLRRRTQLEIASVRFGIATGESTRDLLDGVESVIEMPAEDARPEGIEDGADRWSAIGPDSPLYIMFTSGTTGEPKGSMVTHAGVRRLVDDQPFLCGIHAPRTLGAAPLAFDASTIEIWLPLLTGGSIACWEGGGADLSGMARCIRQEKVNTAWLTSVLFQAAVDGVPELFEELDLVMTGGDVVSAEHVRRLQRIRPGLAVVNGYGPTENTVFTTCEVIAAGSLEAVESIPIGQPIRGTKVRVVDQHGHRVPIGRYGELVAYGSGVALGYIGIDGDDRFQSNESGERGYRTGDRVRWMSDGRLEFSGRCDQEAQVKIGGHRVEYGAVESAIRQCGGVRDVCVTAIGSGPGRQLAAAISGPSRLTSPEAIRRCLEGRLAPAEIPSMIVSVPAIPVTTNGKADRHAVAALFEATPRVEATSERDDDLIAIVMDVFATVTGRPLSSPTQPLSEAGVDSLSLVRIALMLEGRLLRPIDLGLLVHGTNAERIAEDLRTDIARETNPMVVLRGARDPRRPAVYCVPGIGGTVFSYGAILDAVNSGTPVHGLPYPGFARGEKPLDSVEALADRFARTIDENSPAQLIVGYSLGGFVAFETARRIQEMTGVTPGVMVIDSAPAALPSKSGLRGRFAITREFKMRLESVLPPAVVSMLRRDGREATFSTLRRIIAAGFRATRVYSPEPASLDVNLLRTNRTDFGSAANIEDLGWSALASKVRVESIEGQHLNVFRGSSAMELAYSINREYERAGRLLRRSGRAFRTG